MVAGFVLIGASATVRDIFALDLPSLATIAFALGIAAAACAVLRLVARTGVWRAQIRST
jgi:hypothetical protein